jgi:hypothetical protein
MSMARYSVMAAARQQMRFPEGETTGRLEDVAPLIHREALGVDEFGFEILEVGVIEAKLPLQSPIRHALTLAQEGNHLIEDRVKAHPAPTCLCRNDYRPTTAPPKREATCSMYRIWSEKESRKCGSAWRMGIPQPLGARLARADAD